MRVRSPLAQAVTRSSGSGAWLPARAAGSACHASAGGRQRCARPAQCRV